MKIATRKRGHRQQMEAVSSEHRHRSSFQRNVTARTPIPKKATKLSVLVDGT